MSRNNTKSYRSVWHFLVLVTILVFQSVPGFAAFKDPGYAVRPAGMGDAFVAVSDDANSLRFNPAGATQTGAGEISFAYTKPFSGIDDVDLGLNFMSSLAPISDIGVVGLGWASLTGGSFRQQTTTLLLATSLNRWLPDIGPALSAGTNVHFLNQSFDLDGRTTADSVFSEGRNESATAFDLGLWMKPDPRVLPGLALGIVGKSLNEPDLGLSDTDPSYREIVGGAAYTWRQMTFAFDLANRDDVQSWRAGTELWMLRETVALRAGANSTAASAGFSYVLPVKRTLNFALDYAFSFPYYVEETAGSHRVALGVKW